MVKTSLYLRKLLFLFTSAILLQSVGLGATVEEEALSFEIKAFPVDHQGPQVIDVIADLVYVEGIGDKEYPDFEIIRAELIEWMTAYPNESDYWEVFNRVLCLRLLDTYPMVAKVSIVIEVYPTFGIQYAHTSRCVVSRDD